MSGRKSHSKHARRAATSPGRPRNRRSSGGAEAIAEAGPSSASASNTIEAVIVSLARLVNPEAVANIPALLPEMQITDNLRTLFPNNIEQIHRRFHCNMSTEKFKEVLSNFHANMKTTEMFACLLNLKEAHQYLTPKLTMSKKDRKEAEKYRWEGNIKYKSKNFEKALEYFNSAILAAPHPPLPSRITPSMSKKMDAAPVEKLPTSESKADDKTSQSDPETKSYDKKVTEESVESKEFRESEESKESEASKEFIGQAEAEKSSETKAEAEESKSQAEAGESSEAKADNSGEYSLLARAYANRSAVLYKIEKYEKCLVDINFAIMYGISSHNRQLLEERRRKCLSALSIIKPGEAPPLMDPILSFEDLAEMFMKCKFSNEPPTVPELLLSPTKKHREMAAAMAAAVDSETAPSTVKIAQRNESMPCLSNAVAVAYNPDKGRYLIAQRAIRPGEVLAVETFFEKSLPLGFLENLCSNCLNNCYTIHPCPNCVKAVFCSIECWVEGLSGDHSRECTTLSTLVQLQRGSGEHLLPSLAYKIVLNYGFENLKAILPTLRHESKLPLYQRGFNKEGKYDSKDFRTVYHLVTNKKYYSPEELFSRSTTAFILLKLLLLSESYFVDRAGVPVTPTKDEMIDVGGTLFHFLLNLNCNSSEVLKWEMKYDPIKLDIKPLASAVFPTLALANHSCAPTARHYFDGKAMVLRSSTFIQIGMEITDNYSGPYYLRNMSQRKINMTDYNFHCTCEACTGNWGMYPALRTNIHVKCTHCQCGVDMEVPKPKCPHCKLDYTRKERRQEAWRRKVKEIKYAKQRYDYVCVRLNLCHKLVQEDLSAVSNYLEVMQKHADLPIQEFCFTQEILYKLFALGL